METNLSQHITPKFEFDSRGKLINIDVHLRMFDGLIPKMKGLKVLDLGSGFWCFYAGQLGAASAVGIGKINTKQHPKCEFKDFNIGKDFPTLGKFDLIFCSSSYDRIYANIGDHEVIWNWLAELCTGYLFWEGSFDLKRIPKKYQGNYVSAAIYNAFKRHFYCEYSGPGMHGKSLVYKLRRI